jgi:tRNA threonylcarbamoyladenosine biosynthesis protein TsaB
VKILAVDTSQPVGSVALSVDGEQVGAAELGRSESHLVELGRSIDGLLKRGGIAVSSIDRVAVVTGPGSFTGLRIGMAYVKGLHAALRMDIVGITSLELLARQAASLGQSVAPMIDARKDEVYASYYEPHNAALQDAQTFDSGFVEKIQPLALAPAVFLYGLKVRPTVFIGSGAVRYAGEIEKVFGGSAAGPEDGRHEPDTALLCRIAAELESLDPDAVEALEPFYVRPSDAKLKPLRGVHAHD